MLDWLSTDLGTVVGGAVVLVVLWTVIKSAFHDDGKPALHITAYCTHCNWEGQVSRSSMRCARCKSPHVTVIAT